MKHTYKILLAGFAILIGLVVLRIIDPYPIEVLRLKGLDYFQRKQQKVKSDNIAVIEIDEKTLDTFGQYPLPRQVLSDQIKRAVESGASVVVFPILFSEPDRTGGDKVFNDTLQNYPVILSQSASQKGKGQPVPRGIATIGTGINDWLYSYPAAIGPLKQFGQSAAGVGMLLTAPEVDGVTRRLPLAIQVNKETYPALPVEVLRVFGGEESFQAKVNEAGIQAVRVKGIPPINTDANGRVWINFKYSFDSVSMVDKDWSKLKGKVVFIAPTAEGINNTVATPIGISQGYEVSAQTLEMLISNNRLQRPSTFDFYELTAGIILAIILIIAACYLGYILNGLLVTIFLCVPSFIGFRLFANHGYLLDYTWPTLAVLLPWVGALFFRFVQEFKLKQQIKKQFGTYLNPKMVDALQKNPDLLKLGGENKQLTILFSDIRGYTAISEHFGKDVQGLTSLINRYMDTMLPIIMDNDGNVGKLIGDAIMSWHNAPVDVPDHAAKAVKAAKEMKAALEQLNAQLQSEGIPPLGIGIGINTGEVVVGNMGSKNRFSYDILGDAVNLASRLEGQSKPYKTMILIGPITYEQVKDKYQCFELDQLAVKGKKEGVKIYTVLDTPITKNLTEITRMHEGFLYDYRAQNWDNASAIARALIKYNPELAHYYEMMIERMVELKAANLSKDWDGIHRAETK